MLWTENKSEGWSVLTLKLSLFIFPVIFASTRFTPGVSQILLLLFLLGLFTCGLFLLARAIITWQSTGENVFYYEALTGGIMHPSYLSLYYVVGIMIIFHSVIFQKAKTKMRIGASLLIAFFLLMIYLIASKTGLISMGIMLVFYTAFPMVYFRKYILGISCFILLVVGFYTAKKYFHELSDRIETFMEVVESKQKIDPTTTESNRIRILLWQADLAVFEKHMMLGVGTGDVEDELLKEYATRGMTGAISEKLNAHNQFYQTGIAIGILGLIVMVLVFLAAFIHGIRKKFGFISLFTFLLLVNMFPESFLQLAAGVLFIGFFYSLILFSLDRRQLTPFKALSPLFS
jgi:hypothetical protein